MKGRPLNLGVKDRQGNSCLSQFFFKESCHARNSNQLCPVVTSIDEGQPEGLPQEEIMIFQIAANIDLGTKVRREGN